MDFEEKNIQLILTKFFLNFFSIFLSKKNRKRIRRKINKLDVQHTQKKWRIFLKKYFNDELQKFNLKPKKFFSNSKIIWQYWGQGINSANIPDIVNICFASVDKFKGEYEVIRLDDINIHEYLELPDFMWEKRTNPQFKHAFFADVLRLALLDIYGGIWIDATILLTSEIDIKISKEKFFMFQRDLNASDKVFWESQNSDYFGWSEEHCVNVLNSFIVSKKNNNIVHVCLDIMLNYWKTQKIIPHYFFFQIMFDTLIKEFLDDQNILNVDDTLPHLLQFKLKEEFNEKEFEKILNTINIHKTTYIKNYSEKSFYSKIKSFYS